MSQTKCSTSEAAENKVITRRARARRWNASAAGKAARREWMRTHPKLTWAINAANRAKQRSKEKNLPCDVTSKYLLALISTHCPVFGTEFVFRGLGVTCPESPSLDRLDSSKGYVKGNVVVISSKANAIKNAYGSKDIAAVAEWLASYGL
jgi:hypothetical protein